MTGVEFIALNLLTLLANVKRLSENGKKSLLILTGEGGDENKEALSTTGKVICEEMGDGYGNHGFAAAIPGVFFSAEETWPDADKCVRVTFAELFQS